MELSDSARALHKDVKETLAGAGFERVGLDSFVVLGERPIPISLAIDIRFGLSCGRSETRPGRARLSEKSVSAAGESEVAEKAQARLDRLIENDHPGHRVVPRGRSQINRLVSSARGRVSWPGMFSHVYTVLRSCSRCSGRGKVACSCGNGKVRCGCEGGRERCFVCMGRGTRTVSRSQQWGGPPTEQVRCGSCTGGFKPCSRGCTFGWKTCSNCNGRATLDCGTCGATGCLTDIYRPELTATTTKKLIEPGSCRGSGGNSKAA